MTKSFSKKRDLSGLLVDTWWYGLTRRLEDDAFTNLAHLRHQQGFSAIQLVVGIPPEVGPENPNADGPDGPAWSLSGQFNPNYLKLAQKRIAHLNDLGLTVIIFGAWGHQIHWLGRRLMADWWREIVHHFDDLDVIYCLTGESNLWIDQEDMLLPDRSTADLWQPRQRRRMWSKLPHLARRAYRRLRPWPSQHDPVSAAQRKDDWSHVLEAVAQMTMRPIIMHPIPGQTSDQLVNDPALLAANTIQTGHSQQTRNDLWQIPLREIERDPQRPFLNLEPWYEGINNDFYTSDQLYAYWVTMLAGAASYCYGAHGVWNVGDGQFLSHWGRQTFAEAVQLDTPRLLGLSHEQFLRFPQLSQTSFETDGNHLLSITRSGPEQAITFYPNAAQVPQPLKGDIWLPLDGRFTNTWPQSGLIVIFSGD